MQVQSQGISRLNGIAGIAASPDLHGLVVSYSGGWEATQLRRDAYNPAQTVSSYT